MWLVESGWCCWGYFGKFVETVWIICVICVTCFGAGWDNLLGSWRNYLGICWGPYGTNWDRFGMISRFGGEKDPREGFPSRGI